jgi:hypothetical protein
VKIGAMKTKFMRMLGGLFVAGLVIAAPALAVSSVSFGGGRAELLGNNRIRACDTQVDGHRVRAWFYTNLQNPAEPTITPWAPSGGCTEPMAGTWGSPIAGFRICVEAEGCSNPYSKP